MQFITVRDLRGKSAEVWRRLAQEGEIVVTSNGRPMAILSKVTETTLEESLTALRKARAVSAVTAAQRRSVETGKDRLSPAEIDSEIAAVRRRRSA